VRFNAKRDANVTLASRRRRIVCPYDTIRYDTIEEFNVDSKAEYTAYSSTRSQKVKQKQCPSTG